MERFIISGQAIGGKVYLKFRGKSWTTERVEAWIYKDRGRAARRKWIAAKKFNVLVENVQVLII